MKHDEYIDMLMKTVEKYSTRMRKYKLKLEHDLDRDLGLILKQYKNEKEDEDS